jgi:hypothetical protein
MGMSGDAIAMPQKERREGRDEEESCEGFVDD